MAGGKEFIVGVFDDDEVLLKGVKDVKDKGINIHEAYTPFPVHGLEDVLGYKRSYMPTVAFMFGALGTSLALLMQTSMMTFDWPMIIGGKPYFPLPDFIPVTFELTVLLASLGMVFTFLAVRGYAPWKKAKIFDLRATDDKHIVAVDIARNSKSVAEIESALKGAGAIEVNKKTFE